MANRYWVGGSGTWDATRTANWSETSGGVGGASAPTSLDDVYFDSGSDTGSAFTVTLWTGAVNKNFTVSSLDQIMTIAGSATWSCHGNIDIQSGALVVNSHSGSMDLNGTTGAINTIFTSGVPLVPNNGLNKMLNINGGKWLMTSALTLNSDSYQGGLWLNSGIFDTQGYSLTVSNIFITSNSAKELYFRNSTIIARRDGFVNNSTNGTLLFDAGTSTIDIGYGIYGSSTDTLTFFNVNTRGSDGITIIGPQLTIFNNLQCFTNTNVYTKPLQLSGNVIVNNTLSILGKLNLISNIQGIRRTITVNSIIFPNNVPVNFRDIDLRGNASPISGPNLGDAGNNLGINFPASKTVYLVSSQIVSASTLRWSLASGGTATEYLLPQDIGIIDNSAPSSISWPQNEAYIAGTLDFTNRTNAITFTLLNSATWPSVFYIAFNGDLKLSSAVTLVTPTATGLNGDLQFTGHKDQSLITAGQQLNSINVNKFNSALSLGSNLSIASNRTLTVTAGTLNTNNYNISAGSVSSSNSNVRSINLGTSSITLTNTGTVWDTGTSTNLTVQGPGTIDLTSSSAKTFAGGGANYSGVTLVHGGAGNLTISGNNTFSSIRNTISQTAGSSIIFTSGSTTTITGKTGLSGTISAPLYLASSSTGTYTINNSGTSIQQADYLSVNNSIVTPANNWFAGTRSTVTNSTGWSNTFSSAADLFWVGGNGTWDSSTNTNWAVVSGGTGGTIAPTSTNNITFDSNSDAGSAFTVTVGTGAVCKTFSANSENSLDQAMTLAGTASCSINESLLLPSVNFTRTYTGTVSFVGTLPKLINTNGVSFDNNFNFSGVATYNFQSSFTNSGSKDIYFNAGIINTNNFNVSSSRFFLTSANLQQVNLGSSTITISGGVLTGWQVESSATNLVLNSGTSLLRFSYLYGSLLDNRTSGSNKVYYNVEFINSDHNIISDIACNNLTMASAADFIRLRGNLTVNGTLTVLARSSERCVNFYSDALGSTVTANAVNFSRVFFKDITAAGASAPWIGQLGDMGNNNNIQFPAPKTVYWRSTIGDRVYSNSWGFTPTGAIDVNAIPLPQDTGVILDNFPSSGQGIILGWRDMNCGLDFSQRTQSVILNTIFISSSLMGDLILSPSVSFGSTLQSNSLEFYPNLRDIQFNPAGQTITFPISIRSGMNFESTLRTPSINYGFNISGPLNSTKSISVLAGTLNSNNFELSCTKFDSSGSLTRAINLGTSKVNVSGNWNLATSTNLSFTGSGTINMSGTSAKTFAGGSANYSGVILNQGGSGELTVTGNNQFGGISNTVRPASIKFTANTTTTLDKFMFNGTDGALVTISSTTNGTRYTLTSTAGVFAPYYTSIQDSNATGGAVWRAPINYGNVNVSNNLGWDFSNINIMTDNFMVLFPSNLHLTS